MKSKPLQEEEDFYTLPDKRLYQQPFLQPHLKHPTELQHDLPPTKTIISPSPALLHVAILRTTILPLHRLPHNILILSPMLNVHRRPRRQARIIPIIQMDPLTSIIPSFSRAMQALFRGRRYRGFGRRTVLDAHSRGTAAVGCDGGKVLVEAREDGEAAACGDWESQWRSCWI